MRMADDHRARPGARCPDGGFTVTEILVTVVLMGIVVAGILSAVMTGIRASATSRSAARVETALVNAADRINRAGNDKCDYALYAQASVMTEWGPDAGNLAEVTQLQLLPGADATADHSWVAWPGCPSGTSAPAGIVRKVVVTITSPDGAVSRSIDVVKSDV